MVNNFEGENTEFKEQLPLLPIRDLVVYPFMILPLFIGRDSSIKAVEDALNYRLYFLQVRKIYMQKFQPLMKFTILAV